MRSQIAVWLLAAAVAVSTGCAAGARAYMDSTLTNHAEPATVWTRPQEVGFDWGGEVTGEATRQCILAFICWGSEGGGALGGLGAVFSSFSASAEINDPLVSAAAANAVSTTPKADGIFVISHETDALDVFFYSRKVARVRGKAITVRNIGEVSQDRTDKNRNLSALGGRALLQTQP